MEDADWDEGGRQPGTAGRPEDLDREWEARKRVFWQQGYREGIDQGRSETVQQGFNGGFRRGAAEGRAAGRQHAHEALATGKQAAASATCPADPAKPQRVVSRHAAGAGATAPKKAAAPAQNAGGTSDW